MPPEAHIFTNRAEAVAHKDIRTGIRRNAHGILMAVDLYATRPTWTQSVLEAEVIHAYERAYLEGRRHA